ncbi:MAG: RsmE family RNA methyltransferase [Actinomycetota bacterium]
MSSEHLPYFFTDPELITEERVQIPSAEARHLSVRRAVPGDRIRVGDGSGTVVEARLEQISAEGASAQVISRSFEPPAATTLTVFQGLAKSGKVDWVVEKLVELGVDDVVVFSAGRSVPVWDEAKRERMLDRWRRVAAAASKQSHRPRLPSVRGLLSSTQAVDEAAKLPLVLVGDPDASRNLRKVLAGPQPAQVGVVVGPEGGLDTSELERFCRVGALPVGLGPQVLRTETAALAICSVLLFQLGRLG